MHKNCIRKCPFEGFLIIFEEAFAMVFSYFLQMEEIRKSNLIEKGNQFWLLKNSLVGRNLVSVLETICSADILENVADFRYGINEKNIQGFDHSYYDVFEVYMYIQKH